MRKSNLCSVVALTMLCAATVHGYAQQQLLSMTLEECLDYAKENSISLKKAQLEIDNSEADIVSAKGSFLPTVSGSASQSVGINPLADDSNGYYSGSYGVDMSMKLYGGGENKMQLKKSHINAEVATLDYDESANALDVSVAEVYVEILYSIEQIKVAESGLELSVQNEARGKAFLEAGSINEADYAQLQSAKASYQYNVIVAQTQLSNLYVSLKHLLELPQDVILSAKAPVLSDDIMLEVLPTAGEVYDSAIESRPEILSSQLSISTAEIDAQIAKTGYLPTLSLSAGVGVNHNSASDFSFSTQARNNFDASAGLNLSVPIFSQYKNRVAVRQANNDVESANLTFAQTEKDLYQTIETLYNNALTAQAKYSVSQFQLEATQKSLDLTTQQFEVGAKNTIELLTEQNNYNEAYQEFLTNKYQYLYNRAILNYYKTNIIKL
ncbi:MAG: TolC family protein [Rikenellaceae bacterium]